MKTILSTLALFAVMAVSLFADEKVEPKELALSPVPESAPALKHKLLPGFLDRREGNAVPLYAKAIVILADKPVEEETMDLIVGWRHRPPSCPMRKSARWSPPTKL